MKKNTIAITIATVFFGLAIIPTEAKAVTLQQITSAISSITTTIQGYGILINSIASIGTLSSTNVAAGSSAVSNSDAYGTPGVDLSGVAFNPTDTDGLINFDESADDGIDTTLTNDKKTIKTRNIQEFQRQSEFITYRNATQNVAIAAQELEKNNKQIATNAQTSINQAKNTVDSQPIGTCDSSLCAENTYNMLIAQQIDLQSAAISLAITSNAYSKITVNELGVLVKGEQDRKEREATEARLNSINNGSSLINSINAERLIKSVY
jgi:hypothetical protein